MKKYARLLIGAAAIFACVTSVFAQSPGAQGAGGAAQTITTLSAEQRAAITRDLVAKFQEQVRKVRNGDVAAWSAKLAKVVAVADPANILRATTMPTLDAMHAALNGHAPSIVATAGGDLSAPQVLGSTTADTTFTPLPNGRCRVADSRVITSPLPAATTRGIDVEDIASYATQGGNGTFASGDGSTNCGIPSFTTSLVISLTVLNPTANGFFKIFENGTAFQTGNTVLYTLGSFGATSDVIVRSCQTCALELSIYSSAQVDYVIDVIGYFMPAQATALECVDTATNTSPSFPSGSTLNWTAPACPAGYTPTATNCQSSTWETPFVWHSKGTCSAKNNSAGAATISASVTCCRIPGR